MSAVSSFPAPPAPAPEFGTGALIVCDSVVRIYQTGSIEVQALQGLDLAVETGEMVAVVGASGSGKSTLLSILAGIDAPTAGQARVESMQYPRVPSGAMKLPRKPPSGVISAIPAP